MNTHPSPTPHASPPSVVEPTATATVHRVLPDGGSVDAVHAEYDWASVPPSTAVVETVATAANCEPTALDTLYDTLDPDALNALVRSVGARGTAAETTVSFPFDGYAVTVHGRGLVVVRPQPAEP